MNKTNLVEMINNSTELAQKDGVNVSGTLIDWPPLALLVYIYFSFFIKYEEAINKRITKNYKKEMKKIGSAFKRKDQTLSPLGRVPHQENISIMTRRGQRVSDKFFFWRNFKNTLYGSFFIAFGMFAGHIFFTMFNFFSRFLLFMYSVGIFFTLATVVMTCIMARYPKG